ncbi:MAG TPA: putative lipid II flippase FtsW [Candidatus Nanoarchaeia archaeon]|nr:putative lipid II flippase FtsW [Candidatus Nanoarchaeia archaeon]
MKSQAAAGRGHKPDYLLALTVFLLLGIGLIMIYSISPVLSFKLLGSTSRNYYFYGQLGNIAVGLFFWALASQIHYRVWQKWSPLLIAGAAIALLGLVVPGLSFSTNGATRWLKLGPASFQPAELLKLSLIVYLAAWFERRGQYIREFWEGLFPFSIMLAVASFVVVVLQRDMGTMMVLVLAAIGMFYAAGSKLRHVFSIVAGGAMLGWLAIVTFPHRLSRLTVFLDPSKDPSGQGYHISQALIAIGSGGLLGVGLGHSIQIYGYLPEAANDSIFAVIGEEFGLIGCLVIIGLFGFLVYRGLQIAKSAPDSFSRLTAIGISLWLLFQALINIAAMLSLLPLTGIPLPFISYGGSSLVFSLVGAGILLNISKYTVKEVSDANSRVGRRNGWSYFANTGNGRRVKAAR